MQIVESLELAKFLNKMDRSEFSRLLVPIYGSCHSFSSNSEVEIVISNKK
jgi:hypothetical protein